MAGDIAISGITHEARQYSFSVIVTCYVTFSFHYCNEDAILYNLASIYYMNNSQCRCRLLYLNVLTSMLTATVVKAEVKDIV